MHAFDRRRDWRTDGQTDGRTDTFLLASSRWHSMQRGYKRDKGQELQFIQMLTATHWVTYRKQQKWKRCITQQHIAKCPCVVEWHHLFDFCCFRCVTQYVAVNICINCGSLPLHLLFYYRFTASSRRQGHIWNRRPRFAYYRYDFHGATYSSRDMEGSQNSKSRSRDPFATPFGLIFLFYFSEEPLVINPYAKFEVSGLNGSPRYVGVPKFKKYSTWLLPGSHWPTYHFFSWEPLVVNLHVKFEVSSSNRSRNMERS